MQEKGFIKYIVIIIVILVVVFLSQQAFFKGISKTFISAASNQAAEYMAKGTNWAMSAIYPKISGEVQKRGDIITNGVNQAQQKVSEDVGKKIENYFSGVTNSILHPGQNNNNNCQVQPASTSNGQ